MDAKNQNSWEQHRYYMGLDWAKQEHAITVVDGDGRIVVEIKIERTAEGWHRLREKLVNLRIFVPFLIKVAYFRGKKA